MDHSSFVRLKNAGLSTLAVMLISAMPDHPVWVYLGLRGAVTLVRPSCICLQIVKPALSIMHPSPQTASPLSYLVAALPHPTKYIFTRMQKAAP
jgi:hypothetical protein